MKSTMVQIPAVMRRRLNRVNAAIRDRLPVVDVYLFGSQAIGNADESSDIDLAVVSPLASKMSITERARFVAGIQREFGDDLDIHLLPDADPENLDPASFSFWIIHHGVCLTGQDAPSLTATFHEEGKDYH